MSSIGSVLILSEQPVVAALVGMLVEVAGHQPAFADGREAPLDALRRVRPLAVVLVDIDLDASQSDLFFAAASRRTVDVIVFGPEDRAGAIAELTARRSLPWFIMPPEAATMKRLLSHRAAPISSTRGTERRSPAATRTADGTRILEAADGNRWMIYDRRGGADRRRGDRPEMIQRVFVSETGVRLSCPLTETLMEDSADALEKQLERAREERFK